MTLKLISLIIALVTTFLAKKSGASTTEAALLGLTAGGLTYAALDDSDWAKSNVYEFSKTGSTVSETDLNARAEVVEKKTVDGVEYVKYDDGNWYVKGTDGMMTQYEEKEKVVFNTDSSGQQTTSQESVWTTALKETGATLREWGGLGTSAVIATTKAATTSDTSKMQTWMLLAGALAIALIVLK